MVDPRLYLPKGPEVGSSVLSTGKYSLTVKRLYGVRVLLPFEGPVVDDSQTGIPLVSGNVEGTDTGG